MQSFCHVKRENSGIHSNFGDWQVVLSGKNKTFRIKILLRYLHWGFSEEDTGCIQNMKITAGLKLGKEIPLCWLNCVSCGSHLGSKYSWTSSDNVLRVSNPSSCSWDIFSHNMIRFLSMLSNKHSEMGCLTEQEFSFSFMRVFMFWRPTRKPEGWNSKHRF